MINLANSIARGSLFAIVAAGVTIGATASFAVPSYDGLWSVSIVTEKGACDRGYRYPVRITNGLLSNAGNSFITVSGKVQPTGKIVVTVSNGSSSATGTGRLDGRNGAGRWSAGECSGTWTAERRNTVDNW